MNGLTVGGVNCPKCGAIAVNMTSVTNTTEQFICTKGCGLFDSGIPLDPEFLADQRAKIVGLQSMFYRETEDGAV